MIPHRIIVTGKNRDLPKVASICLGVRVDGTEVRAPIFLRSNEALCTACGGDGSIETWDGNPSSKLVTVRCETCDGQGIVEGDL